jgi:1,4-dihydroxy-2-naphthoate octaprenyltransferase
MSKKVNVPSLIVLGIMLVFGLVIGLVCFKVISPQWAPISLIGLACTIFGGCFYVPEEPRRLEY